MFEHCLTMRMRGVTVVMHVAQDAVPRPETCPTQEADVQTALAQTPTAVEEPSDRRAPQGEDAPQREEQRLTAAVADIADILSVEARSSDAQGRLTERAVHALRSHDLWRMRLCQDLGGLEVPIVTQIQVLAALAAVDASSAWCTMVANNAVAVLGSTMPAAATAKVFADGVPACAIVAAPGGKATETDGGFLVNGKWRLASGIHHADWVHATAHVDGDPARLLPLALPAKDLTLLDAWSSVGLAATGSDDFSLSDYFVPTELTGRATNPYAQLRGTRRYDLAGLDHLESYEHLAFAIGVTRRALAELRQLLARGFADRRTADREVVQSQLGQAEVSLRAIEALALSIYGRIDAAAMGEPHAWSAADRHLPRAVAVQATELALQSVQLAFHRSGAVALRSPNILERLLRDVSVAATHFMVDDAAVAEYGQHLIESVDTNTERQR